MSSEGFYPPSHWLNRLPQRRDFDVLDDLDEKKKGEWINWITSTIQAAVEDFVYHNEHGQHFQTHVPLSPELVHDIAETIYEAAYILDLEDPPQFKVFLADTSIIALAGLAKTNFPITVIGVNILKLVEWTVKYRFKTARKSEVRDTIAHEVAHHYVRLLYKKAHDRSVSASTKVEIGDRTDYDKDRAEQFVNAFAKRYSEYKNE